MIQLPICSTSSLVNNCWFQVDENCSGDVFARRHVTVRLDSMLKTVKFPTGISNLA